MSQPVSPVRDLVHIALFAAVTAVLGLMPPIPVLGLPVPITLQSMGPMLAGALIGGRKAGLSLVLFLVLVALGLPLLAGGRGGVGVFFGPTVGYLFGWAIVAWLIGHATDRLGERPAILPLFGVIALFGIGVLYAIGIPATALVLHAPLGKVAMASAVFIPGDLVKAGITAIVAVQVRRAYPLAAARR